MSKYPQNTVIELANALERADVPYALIGGVAVALVGTPRYTQDVDAVIWIDDSDILPLLAKLASFGFTSRSADPVPFAAMYRMILLKDQDDVEVDLALGLLEFERAAIEEARSVPVDADHTVRVASPQSLLVMKAIAGRPKDHEDMRQLLLMNDDLEREQILTEIGAFAMILERDDIVEQARKILEL